MGTIIEADDSFTKILGRWPIFYYGTGHMLNDITAACWFTYLLLFLTDIGLSSRNAAAVMLSGQVADGFATIFVGELIDRFGHFKIWHGAGSLLVAISFSSVFGVCLPCNIFGSNSSNFKTVSYSVFAAIFNVGWAATQVSHMSMVSCITLNSTSRVALASCRNAFTMVANLSLYAVALIIFSVINGKTHADVENQYRWIAYLSIFIGCCFVGIFHLATKEPRLKVGVHGKAHARISWVYWFKRVLYYQVALVYVLTRLVLNVSQAYLAFFVINDLQMAQSAKALVPAIIYICSFIVSIALQEIAWTGRLLKAYYSAGCILWIFCGAVILLLSANMSYVMYIASIFIGIANALMTVTGVSMQNFLIGESLNGCAFVVGSLSFLDKISCGLALYVLQSYQNISPKLQGTQIPFSVTRVGLGLVPAFCALVGVVVTCTMDFHNPSKALTMPLLV
ncbi:major facilitator superfamily domain-containing protein 12-like [Abrus precatorius]|uniref:Major facilitator superfamily domain-containing protein 12-like n=1 Tax=Abrus precatorius TaxID=3816 RepID=A0A8B8K8B5_ABRPR|nr:major facilitator superfamily domain-containing protein 12-like [Abrus precatorius]XP_027339973.1 major facilitator superfamily domain-containing protein 12-like [Abrus precatorius]XP_027339974.1 major facilitator superfamily domain-containing protein 12-like [Abrus precatorius]XP_027339975.1 major facilitator superfamily domain-containing protein 12-like [Abrus precatorius]